MKNISRKFRSFPRALSVAALSCLLLLALLPLTAGGEELEEETLSVIGGAGDETVSTGRFARPVSRTAENVAVISAEEIELYNAHTLADVLNLIPGVQLELQTGPASAVNLSVQGSDLNHVLVLVDGIQWNSLLSNFADVGAIPAQTIERVEVLKGAASSSWGPALGGVINVITKAPAAERPAEAFASYSRGEHDTDDARAEVTGTVQRLGYYLYGGFFGTDGFQPNTEEKLRTLYHKLTYDFPGEGRAVFSFGLSDLDRGEFALPNGTREDAALQRLTFSLLAAKPLTDRFDLELGARFSRSDNSIFDEVVLPQGVLRPESHADEEIAGGSVKALWHGGSNILVLGADIDRVTLDYESAMRGINLRKGENRYGVYLNDSFSIGPLTIAPGVRYDRTGNAGTQWSPSLGATFQAGEHTTLRSYVAKGYGLTSLMLDTAEKVWTAQVGGETSAIPYLWLKGTLFHNEVDAVSLVAVRNPDGSVRAQQAVQHQVKQGLEFEARTAPYLNTSFSLGYTYLDARRTADDSVLPNRQRHLLLAGVRYDDRRLLSLALLGRQVDWRAQEEMGTKDAAMVWDAHLTVTPFGRGEPLPQFFLSIRNLFDGRQYLMDRSKNPSRWIEVGARWRF